MHQTQRKILDLAKSQDLGKLSLRQIGASIEVEHPQKVKYHLEKLIKKGLLEANSGRDKIQRIPTRQEKGGLFAIPILGSANAGPAMTFADEAILGHLRISKQLVPNASDKLFAIRVSGESMNKSQVNGKFIQDGDFIIVDADNVDPPNGSVVLSVIGDVANIKRFTRDDENKQVVLTSESDHEFAPIYIHQEDQSDYLIAGVVVDVFKKPKV